MIVNEAQNETQIKNQRWLEKALKTKEEQEKKFEEVKMNKEKNDEEVSKKMVIELFK